jgi:hypothetical protein
MSAPIKAPPRVRAVAATAPAAPRAPSRFVKVGPAETPEAAARAITTGPKRSAAQAILGGPSQLVLDARRRVQDVRSTVAQAVDSADTAFKAISTIIGAEMQPEEVAVYQTEGLDLEGLRAVWRAALALTNSVKPANPAPLPPPPADETVAEE